MPVEPEGKPTPASTGAEFGSKVAELVPGQKVGVGRYTLIKFLGKGGMGIVWLARDEHLHDEVALKFLPAEIHHDVEALDDMRRETLKSRKLSHPNIIRIHDLHVVPGESPFISMEYIDGAPLNVLKMQQPQRLFTWEHLKPIIQQLCEALNYAHTQKVIHRDLKPANMMVTKDGVLKLADFGIAAVVSDSMSRVSLKHSTSGTVVYMSPQQMNGQKPQPSDDIYALGATIYELLTSKPPFFTGDIFNQVQNVEPKPLAERLADLESTNDIPSDVSAMVMACLSKDPAQRPPSAGAVAEWIGLPRLTQPTGNVLAGHLSQNDLLAAEALSVAPASADEAVSTPTRNHPKGWWIGASVLVVLLLGLGIWQTKTKLDRNRVEGTTKLESPGVSPATPSTTSRYWTNSLGMVFVPVPGSGVNFSIWHTRVQDFEAFVKATGYDATEKMTSLKGGVWSWHGDNWKSPGFEQGPTHPVCGVSVEDAQAFCEWLTEKDRSAGKLTAGQRYRLPLDWEWSVAVGLTESREGTPQDKSEVVADVYPWGKQWPPPAGAGNYAGEEVRIGEYPANYPVIEGYRDGFARTSPVGSFKSNQHGLYDMGGNLWQWCEYVADGGQRSRVLRGGSWFNADPRAFLSSHRDSSPADRTFVIGFRCVLVMREPSP